MHRNGYEYDYQYDWNPSTETKSSGSHHNSKKAREEKKDPPLKVGHIAANRSPSPEKPAAGIKP